MYGRDLVQKKAAAQGDLLLYSFNKTDGNNFHLLKLCIKKLFHIKEVKNKRMEIYGINRDFLGH